MSREKAKTYTRNKLRHLYRWSPHYLWQMLRWSKSYRQAESRFRDSITELPALRSAYERLSTEEPIANVEERKKALVGIRSAQPYSEVLLRCLEHKQYRQFMAQFGDILWFPISAKTRFPKVEMLQAIWKFRPVTVLDEWEQEFLTRVRSLLPACGGEPSDVFGYKLNPHFMRRVGIIPVLINNNFHLSTIAGDMEKALFHYHDISSVPTETDREELYMTAPLAGVEPKWEDFDSYIEVFNLRREHPTMTPQEIGRRLLEKRHGKKHSRSKGEVYKELVETRTNKVQELIELMFERPVPKEPDNL